MSREFEYWTPEPLFANRTVFCLASGPSLTREMCEKIRGRKAIVINSSYALALWADVLYFTDGGWYEPRRDVVREWPGLVVSMCRTAKRELPDKVKRVQGEGDPMLPANFARAKGVIQQGRSSGHTAVSLAIAMGANRVVLLGYDMQVVNPKIENGKLVGGIEHCHQEYAGQTRDLDQYRRDFVPAFNGWNEAAKAVGVEILNATPDSALTEFPFIELEQILEAADVSA